MRIKYKNKIIFKRVSFSFALLVILILPSCTKIEREAKVETGAVTDITATSAKAEGNIIDLGNGINDYGHCWSIASNPTINDSKTSLGAIARTGSFTSTLQSLQPGTKYYLRAYVKSGNDIEYGSELSFSTSSIVLATLTTTSVTSITSTTAVSGGNISSDGGSAVTARGVCWSTTANPSTANNKTSEGTGLGIFISSITGLQPGTTYHVRAYATNIVGTAFGNEITFTTLAVIPTLTTIAPSGITQTTATSGGDITSNGGATVTSRGVCWGISNNPTITSSHTSDGSGSGTFTSSITGLTPGTVYYVRAYATNSAGIAYGNEHTFTTGVVVVPTLTTAAASSITATSAITGGNITSAGGGVVSARGVCWSTLQNPTITNNITTNGSGTGSFTSNLTGLTVNTTYYIRAYATNSAGTAYGNQINFTTDPVNVTDVDGNIYNVIRIGTQLWMKENLKTTKYNDVTSIPNVTDFYAWAFLTSPAYCWYNNVEVTYKDPYGALYNWYAVNTGKLCPTGWHVPSDSEWTILTTYLGGESVAGGKLKEIGTTHWLSPNMGATNEVFFTALPGGTNGGGFVGLGEAGYWWAADEYPIGSNNALDRFIVYYDSFLAPTTGISKSQGFSIRCVKNN